MSEKQIIITYLVLAHNQPDLLINLLKKLNNQNVQFFIHWDKRSTEGKNKVMDFCEEHENMNFLSHYKVNWMGFSIVQSTLLLIEESLYQRPSKYYVLISGQDYPIKSNQYILEFFNKSTKDFISLNFLNDLGTNFENKVKYWHFLDNSLWNPKSKSKNKLMFRLYFSLYFNRLQKLFKRRMINHMVPYFGSQWFALTHNTIKEILTFTKENPEYSKFMKHVESPDEVFFHTILGNIPSLRANVMEIEEFDLWSMQNDKKPPFKYHWGSLRYMDWESPNREKPAVLDMRDFDKLKNSHLLFCRKVDNKSAELIRNINFTLET